MVELVANRGIGVTGISTTNLISKGKSLSSPRKWLANLDRNSNCQWTVRPSGETPWSAERTRLNWWDASLRSVESNFQEAKNRSLLLDGRGDRPGKHEWLEAVCVAEYLQAEN